MLKPPGDGTRLELSSFVRPDSVPGSPAAMANEMGLLTWPSRSTTCRRLSIRQLPRATDWSVIGEYEGAWRMAYVRGPEGIIVSLAERIG